MPTKRTRSRMVAILAVAALSMGAMSPALADPPKEIPPAQAENVDGEALGAEQAAAGEAIAAARHEFATVTVQQAVQAFLAEVERFTSCMNDNASSNEGTAQEGVTYAYDECGPMDVSLSPGHVVSALHIE